MKATLKFDLHEESEEFKDAFYGWRYHECIDTIKEHLRSKLKYTELEESEYKIYEKIYKDINEIINEIINECKDE